MTDEPGIEADLARMAQEACANPGTFGVPFSLEKGRPLDSDCVAVWIAARLRPSGARIRLVALHLEGAGIETVLEIWHPLAKSWLRIDPLGILPARHERVAELEVRT